MYYSMPNRTYSIGPDIAFNSSTKISVIWLINSWSFIFIISLWVLLPLILIIPSSSPILSACAEAITISSGNWIIWSKEELPAFKIKIFSFTNYFSWDWIAVIITVLKISFTVHPLLKSFTGLLRLEALVQLPLHLFLFELLYMYCSCV